MCSHVLPCAPSECSFTLLQAAGKWADFDDPGRGENRWKVLGLDREGALLTERRADAQGTVREYPLNPLGRTGLRGRGSLGRWGPNPTIDPIITRRRRGDGDEDVYEMLAERRPNFQCGIPGAVVSAAEEMAFGPWDLGKRVHVGLDEDTVEVYEFELESASEGEGEGASGRDRPEAPAQAGGAAEHAAPATRRVKWHPRHRPAEGLEGTIVGLNSPHDPASKPPWTVTIQPDEGAAVVLRIPRHHPMPHNRLGWKLEALIRYYEHEQREVYATDQPSSIAVPLEPSRSKTGADAETELLDQEQGYTRESVLTRDEFSEYKMLWDRMVEDAEIVYQGPVDDVRDTDNAWNETTVLHFEISEDRGNDKLGELLGRLPNELTDAGGKRRCHLVWLAMDRLAEPRYNSLFAAHRKWVDMMKRTYLPHRRAGAAYRDMQILRSSSSSQQPGGAQSLQPLDEWLAATSVAAAASEAGAPAGPPRAAAVAKVHHDHIRLAAGSLMRNVNRLEPAFTPADIGKIVLIEGDKVTMFWSSVLHSLLALWHTTSSACKKHMKEATEDFKSMDSRRAARVIRLYQQDRRQQFHVLWPKLSNKMSVGAPRERNLQQARRANFTFFYAGQIASVGPGTRAFEGTVRLTNGAEFKNPAYAPVYISYIPKSDRDRKEPNKLNAHTEFDGTKVERHPTAELQRLGLDPRQPLVTFRPNDASLKELDPAQIIENKKVRIRDKRGSFEFPVEPHLLERDPTLPPQNPRGRTGFCGLGELRLWGPNHAVDMIITRHDPATTEWQVLTIYDPEKDQFSLPGKRLQDKRLKSQPITSIMHTTFKDRCLRSLRTCNKVRSAFNARGGSREESAAERMLDRGDLARSASELAHDEMDEGSTPTSIEATQRNMQYQREEEGRRMRLTYLLEDLFSSRSTDLYRGYVDDDRNTDNAWVETTCLGFHCPEELAAMLDFVRHQDVHPLELELKRHMAQRKAKAEEAAKARKASAQPKHSTGGSTTGAFQRSFANMIGRISRASPDCSSEATAADPSLTLRISGAGKSMIMSAATASVNTATCAAQAVRRSILPVADALGEPSLAGIDEPLSLARLHEVNEAIVARDDVVDEVLDPLALADEGRRAIALCADPIAPKVVDALRSKRLPDVRWLKIDLVPFARWHRGHSRLVNKAVANLERTLKEPGLLEIVVNFGRASLAERVLHAPKLADERSPLKLQRVFSNALHMASVDRTFDLNILTVLMQHGAKISDVGLTGLFDTSATPMRMVQDVLDQRQATLVQRRAATKGSRFAAVPMEARDEHPWAGEYAYMLDVIIPGFRHYANERNRKKEPVSAFDLMCWAISCGATKLALFLWRLVDSSPLRAALIGQQLCERFRVMEYNLDQDVRSALKNGESEFNEANRALLSSIISQKQRGDSEEAKRQTNEMIREIIYPDLQLADDLGLIHGKNPNWVQRLGKWIFKRLDERPWTRGIARVFEPPKPAQRRLLALAVEFHNEQFTSHPCCANLVDDIWRGNHPLCGRLMFTAIPQLTTRVVLSLCIATMLPVSRNPLPIKMNPTYLKGAKLPTYGRQRLARERRARQDSEANDKMLQQKLGLYKGKMGNWHATARSHAAANKRSVYFDTSTHGGTGGAECEATCPSSFVNEPRPNLNPAAPFGVGGGFRENRMPVCRFRLKRSSEPSDGSSSTMDGNGEGSPQGTPQRKRAPEVQVLTFHRSRSALRKFVKVGQFVTGTLSKPTEVEKSKSSAALKDVRGKRGKRIGARRKYSKRSDIEAREMKENRHSLIDLLFQAKDVWRIPMMKQFHASVALIVFMMLLVLSVFTRLCGPIGVVQWMFGLWVISYVVQELHQFWRAPVDAMGDFYTFVDWSLCALYLLALWLRRELDDEGTYWGSVEHNGNNAPNLIAFLDVMRLRDDPDQGRLRPHPWTFDENRPTAVLDGVPDLGQCDWSIYLELLRTVLAVSVIFVTGRVFEILTFEKEFARIWFTLETIYGRDMGKIIFLPILFMIGFGIALSVLSPNFQLEGSDGPFYVLRDFDNFIDVSAGSPFWQAMYGLFGAFDGIGLASAPGAALVTPLVLYIYLFLVALPIVNLLIAVFSESYEQMDEDSARAQWHLRNAQQMQLYLRLYYALPMPLNLVALPCEVVIFFLSDLLPSMFWRCSRRALRRKPVLLKRLRLTFERLCYGPYAASGRRWRFIGRTKPALPPVPLAEPLTGLELHDASLARALSTTPFRTARDGAPLGIKAFSAAEWREFGIIDPLTTAHFIGVDNPNGSFLGYFRPECIGMCERAWLLVSWLACCCGCCLSRAADPEWSRSGRFALRARERHRSSTRGVKIDPNRYTIGGAAGDADTVADVGTPLDHLEAKGKPTTSFRPTEAEPGTSGTRDVYDLGARATSAWEAEHSRRQGTIARRTSADTFRERADSTPKDDKDAKDRKVQQELSKRYWRLHDLLIDDLRLQRFRRFWDNDLLTSLTDFMPDSKEEAQWRLNELFKLGVLDELEEFAKRLQKAKKTEEAARDKYCEQEREEEERAASKHEAIEQKLRFVEASNKQAVREAVLEARNETKAAIRDARNASRLETERVSAQLLVLKQMLEAKGFKEPETAAEASQKAAATAALGWPFGLGSKPPAPSPQVLSPVSVPVSLDPAPHSRRSWQRATRDVTGNRAAPATAPKAAAPRRATISTACASTSEKPGVREGALFGGQKWAADFGGAVRNVFGGGGTPSAAPAPPDGPSSVERQASEEGLAEVSDLMNSPHVLTPPPPATPAPAPEAAEGDGSWV